LLLLLLLVRGLATTLTVAAGGVGGVFIPLFVEGWILGAAVEVVVSSDTLLFPVIGAAAFLGAGYRTPIAAVVFVAESTGRPGFIVPALLATAVAQLVMGRQSVTGFQLPRRLDPLERALRLPVAAAMVRVPEYQADAPLTGAFARPEARAASVIAIVDGTTWVGSLDQIRATALIAANPSVTAREAVRVDGVVADPDWTLGRARDVMASDGIGILPVVDRGRFLGVVTAASILKLERTLRS
jgi:CBS domain-containing protein